MKTFSAAALLVTLVVSLQDSTSVHAKQQQTAFVSRSGVPSISKTLHKKDAFIGDNNKERLAPPPPPRGGALNKKAEEKGLLWDFIVKKIEEWLTSSTKLPWTICTVLSLYYFYLYNYGNSPVPLVAGKDYYKEGFCVTGLNPGTGLCSQAAGNSHQFAWGIDVLFTLGALIIPFTGWAATNPTDDSGKWWFFLNAVVIAFVVIAHGFLHHEFSIHSCNLNDPAASKNLIKATSDALGGPELAYALFVFILMLVDLAGFSCLPSLGWPLVIGVAVAVTAVVVNLSTGDANVSSFFMISQVAVSLTGLLIPNPDTVTPQLGWSFIAPCVVSLLEYSKCNNFLVQYGGHSWYDFWLHLSMMISLLFGIFKPPAAFSGMFKK